jgi:uncharacterized phosphosugar-binding protein
MTTHTRSTVLLLQLALVPALLASPSDTIRTNSLAALETMQANWQAREAAAEAAADRFLGGGQLWVAGSIPRFDIEWLGRAGGLMPVVVMKDPAAVAAGDVLVYGCLQGAGKADAALLRQVHEKGALIVAFGGASQADELKGVADHFLANGLPVDTPMATQVAAPMDLAQLWAFTGDLVGACTRAGKMPTMWQSVMVPGARDRNAKYRPLRFHEDRTLPAQESGALGKQYLTAVVRGVTGLRTQQRQMAAAGAAIRETVKAGRTVFHANLGHFEPARLLPEAFGVPLVVLPGAQAEAQIRAKGKRGDCVLLVWYTEMPTALLQAARDAGVPSICMVASNPAQPLDTSLADIFLDPQWVFGDAAVEIPGYDVKVLPPSGVLNSLVFYSVLAEGS